MSACQVKGFGFPSTAITCGKERACINVMGYIMVLIGYDIGDIFALKLLIDHNKVIL